MTLGLVAVGAFVSSVGVPGVTAAQGNLPAAEQPALRGLTIIAPAAPGGGWDQLAREMQREIERQGAGGGGSRSRTYQGRQAPSVSLN